MMTNSFAGKSVLITGASAGLGEEFARQLVGLGVTKLVLTARRLDRLEQISQSLLETNPQLIIKVITADLSLPTGTDHLIANFEALSFHPDILINNAGLGDLGTFETSDPSRIEAMLTVNISSLTRLTRWALPFMLKQARGWICNVGSTAGVVPMLPNSAVYGGTKAYVNSFSEALHLELSGSGIHVSVLAPGPVETEFFQVAVRPNGPQKFLGTEFFYVHKAQVVRNALSGLARNQARVIPGLFLRLVMLLMIEPTPRWILRLFFGTRASTFQQERKKRQEHKTS